jgi:predicted ATPase/class 3 adenylate cyclase
MLPTGTVTFLYSDIEGSTPLWERVPQDMQVAIAQHHAILRQVVERKHGVIFDTEGDSFKIAFQLPQQALYAAIECQRSLRAANWPSGTGPLQVRMGLHTGTASTKDAPGAGLHGGAYTPSHTLNRTARVMAAGHGGQILLSQETANLVERELPESIALKDMGEHFLKGLARREHIYQVITPDLPVDFPPLATLISHPHNLPLQLTSFIGRESNLAGVCERLRDPEVRLLTLTGVGGTGKTRLAICAGQEMLEDYPDGVFFVNLAPVREPALVISAIAQIFSLHEIPSRPLTEVLKDFLAKKAILLILDNFEQVLEAGPDLLELLVSAPQIKMLVTSRALLRLSGEVDYPLQPLNLPASLSMDALVENEAILLFVERARAVSPDFHLTAENAPSVAKICRRLDGLPLAIELAAPRLRLLSPPQMLQQLQHSLDLLVGGKRDLPARHQTMRAAIAWSYSLLNKKEKSLFCRLGVFAGGCTLAAATAVCETVDLNDPDGTIDVLGGIESLLDQNLLRRSDRGGERRFWMYETIREYAQEQLERSTESWAVHQAFARIFTRDDCLGDHHQMTLEIDNLRAVQRWSIDSGDADPGLIIGGEFLFWIAHASEARRWLQELLATPAAQTAAERPGGLYGAASLAYFNGDLAESIKLFREYEDLIQQSPNRDWLVDYAHYERGFIEAAQGYYDRAILEMQEMVRAMEKAGDNNLKQAGLGGWAGCELVKGNISKARELLQSATKLKLEGNFGRTEIHERRMDLGWCDLAEDKLSDAERRFKEELIWAKESGYRTLYNPCMRGLAAVALKRKQLERSARLYGATEQVCILLGHTTGSPWWETMHQRYFTSLREQIDLQAFERAWHEGRNMSLDEALAYALET